MVCNKRTPQRTEGLETGKEGSLSYICVTSQFKFNWAPNLMIWDSLQESPKLLGWMGNTQEAENWIAFSFLLVKLYHSFFLRVWIEMQPKRVWILLLSPVRAEEIRETGPVLRPGSQAQFSHCLSQAELPVTVGPHHLQTFHQSSEDELLSIISL